MAFDKTARAGVSRLSAVVQHDGAWYDRRRQVATAEIDRDDRPLRVTYLDGTRRDYATSTDPVIAGKLAAGGVTVEAASGRLYLMRQEVLTAEVAANDRVLRATMLGGAIFPPRGSGGGTPTPTPTPTPGVATSLEAGGFVVSAVTERLYLLRQEVVCATVDTVGKALRADLLGGGSFPPRILPPVVTTPALADIVCVGDSLTAAGYGNVLATLTGRTVSTLAIGGQTSRHIVGRMSAVAYRLTVENNQLVAGANTITAINGQAFVGMSGAPSTNVQFLATASNNTLYTAKGWFGSVYGTATRVVSGGPPSTGEGMTFTPDPGQPLPIKIPAETPFVVDYPFDARTHIIWPGRNNYRDVAQVLSDVDAMVRRIGHSRIILMPPPNGDIAGERASATNPVNYNCFRTLENAMSEKYPRFYLPIRRLLIDKALPALGITPTAQDLIDIADDTVPASGRTDTVHHTTAVRGFIAAEVAAQLTARGI